MKKIDEQIKNAVANWRTMRGNAFGYCLDVDPCDKRRTREEEQEFRDSITEEV